MQGESDAEHSIESSDAYLENLSNLTRYLCADLKNEKLPVVIGEFNDSHVTPDGKPTQPFIKSVHLAQKEFTDQDDCQLYITKFESYKLSSDAWNYDTNSFV